jgi:hypothetical protein
LQGRRGSMKLFFLIFQSCFVPPSYFCQAIDVLERTLDDGFDTSFEPKEYIRIYT